jgi:hypothetical protein
MRENGGGVYLDFEDVFGRGVQLFVGLLPWLWERHVGEVRAGEGGGFAIGTESCDGTLSWWRYGLSVRGFHPDVVRGIPRCGWLYRD